MPEAHKDEDVYEDPGGTIMKLPSSIMECFRRFCVRVPRDIIEFPISSAISISRKSLSSSILSVVTRVNGISSIGESHKQEFSNYCTHISSTGLCIALVSGDVVVSLSGIFLLFFGTHCLDGEEVALPRKTESLMSASLRVSNAPRTVALNRSFCDKEEVMVASPKPGDDPPCMPSGCCFRNLLSASADFDCA